MFHSRCVEWLSRLGRSVCDNPYLSSRLGFLNALGLSTFQGNVLRTVTGTERAVLLMINRTFLVAPFCGTQVLIRELVEDGTNLYISKSNFVFKKQASKRKSSAVKHLSNLFSANFSSHS